MCAISMVNHLTRREAVGSPGPPPCFAFHELIFVGRRFVTGRRLARRIVIDDKLRFRQLPPPSAVRTSAVAVTIIVPDAEIRDGFVDIAIDHRMYALAVTVRTPHCVASFLVPPLPLSIHPPVHQGI